MKIRIKLILGFLTMATLVAVVGYLSAGSSQEILQKTIGERSVALADEILNSIDRRIFSRIESLQEYSKDTGILQAIMLSNREFEKLYDIQVYIDEKDRQWTSVPKEHVTPFMQELIDNKLSKRLREKTDFYEEKYGYNVFGEVFVTNKYGANIAQTGKTTDYYQADEIWWQKAKQDGLYITDVEYDESADVYSVDICLRIDDKNKDFLGVVKAVLNIEEIVSLIKNAEAAEKKFKTLEFELVTKDAKLIYSTKGNVFLEPLPETLAVLLQDKHSNYHIVGQPITAGDAPGNGKRLFSHVYSGGYRDFKGLGWVLAVELETGEVFALINQLKTRILIISLGITVLAVLLSLFISKTIAGPVQKLAVAAADIGGGNLNTFLDVQSKDEVGQLADSFNQMIKDLKRTTASIDDLNREIDDRKKAEAEVKLAFTKLEQVNEELVSAHSQLIQSEKLASIGQLAAGVAHEINNPVGFVSSNFETLENYSSIFIKLLSAYEEYIGEIKKSAEVNWIKKAEAIDKIREDLKIDFILGDIKLLFEDSKEGLNRITRIIQSLRDFSRIDQITDICEFNLNDGIRDTLVVAKNEIKYDCTIKTELSEIPAIYCNPGQINQVLLNILVNAAQAIKSQKRSKNGTIIIRTYALDEEIVCEIFDDGPGIPPNVITQIFNPFFTTKAPGQGTGLGLSISHDIIVNKHKGQLLVDSTIGVGTTLTIKLPIHFKSNEEILKEDVPIEDFI